MSVERITRIATAAIMAAIAVLLALLVSSCGWFGVSDERSKEIQDAILGPSTPCPPCGGGMTAADFMAIRASVRSQPAVIFVVP